MNVIVDCRKMHLRPPEQLKMPHKNSLTTADIFHESHDVGLKVQDKLSMVFGSSSLNMADPTSFRRLLLS